VSVSIIVTSTLLRRFLALRLLVMVFAASCLFVFFLNDFDLCAGPFPFSLLLDMSAIAQSAPLGRRQRLYLQLQSSSIFATRLRYGALCIALGKGV